MERFNNEKCLVVLEPHEYEQGIKDGSLSSVLASTNVCVLTDKYINSNSLKKINEISTLECGYIYIKDAYENDKYNLLCTKIKQNSIIENHNKFTELCQLLGAKEVKVSECVKENRKSDIKVEAIITGEKKINELFNNRLVMKSTFSEGDMDIDKAKTYLQENNLEKDSTMCSLYNMRKLKENKLTKKIFKLKTSREVTSSLDALAKINWGPLETYLKFAKKISETEEYQLEIKVQF